MRLAGGDRRLPARREPTLAAADARPELALERDEALLDGGVDVLAGDGAARLDDEVDQGGLAVRAVAQDDGALARHPVLVEVAECGHAP